MDMLIEKATKILSINPFLESAIYLSGSVIVALISWLFLCKFLFPLATKTETKVDDEIIKALQRPIVWSIILLGISLSFKIHNPSEKVLLVSSQILISVAIFLWTKGAFKIIVSILEALSRNINKNRFIQPRTLPLFEVTFKTIIAGSTAYGLMITWHIDIAAWLASAGIVGIAVGFAAKDTLANFFAGIFIIADAPYQLGDIIVLDSGERGLVTDIGIRSTRILTLDDIQIVIPNASIANAKIINETGGPSQKRRIKISVGVAYGSNIDKVKNLLLDIANKSSYLAQDPAPKVHFWQFGESSLDFHLLGWIEEPSLLGDARDSLNTTIYKQLSNENIEIPFPQRDIHMKKN